VLNGVAHLRPSGEAALNGAADRAAEPSGTTNGQIHELQRCD
jgi:hypothetical protein